MIVVPALHPAWDVIAAVDRLEPGHVHRTARLVRVVGGKAVNVARFAAAVGADVRLVLLADEALAEAAVGDPSLAATRLRTAVVPSPAPTRTDLALVDADGRLTVVNGEADRPGPAALARFEAECLAGLARDDVLALAGSAPRGSLGLLGRLGRAARERGARVLVDASGPWLRAALATRPDAVKVNAAEAGDADTGAAATGAAATGAAARRPARLAAVPVVGITAGERGLRAWVGDHAYLVEPPGGVDVVNPLGAGDAVTAGLAVSLAAGDEPIEGFALGVAMATARLRHFEPALRAAEVRKLRPRVRVTRLR